jgi:hypothetical protein
MIPSSPFYLVLAILVAVLGVGRLTRILVYDDYPPTMWLRRKWIDLTKAGPWAKLATCLWCASPYVAAVCVAWGALSFNRPWEWTWWVFWGTLSVAYVAAMVLVRDEPAE